MRDEAYYRLIISKRAAVKALLEIAEAALPYGKTNLSSYGCYSESDVLKLGRADGSLYNLISTIKGYKRDAEKYHQLRKLLKEIIE